MKKKFFILIAIFTQFSDFSFIKAKNIFDNDINTLSSNHIQKFSMEYVVNIVIAIRETDYDKAIFFLAKLKTIDFNKITSPLSLVYDLINGIGDGREDFLVLAFKNILFKEIRKISQKIFLSMVIQKQFVSKETKKTIIERLNSIKNNLDPEKEACANVLKDIEYTMAVINSLPENNNSVIESLIFLTNIIKIVSNRDTKSLKVVLNTIVENGKGIYQKNMLYQVSLIEAISNTILSNNPEFFDELLNIYEKTNIPEVKYEIIKTFGKICRLYYGSNTGNKSLADCAYTSFKLLLEAVSSSKIFSINSLWWVRCGAAEELILLENKLQDVNAKKTVQRYLKELIIKEENRSNNILTRLNNKLKIPTSNKNVLCVLKNPQQIYNIKLIEDTTKNNKFKIDENEQNLFSILNKSLENQKEILEILKNKQKSNE